MAHYKIQHHTRYSYTEPVSICHNLAYLLPRLSDRHYWYSSRVAVEPEPTMLLQRQDYFGNLAMLFALQEPHRRLDVTAESEVEVSPLELAPELFTQWPWEQVLALLNQNPEPEHLDACQFTFPSPYIIWPESVQEYAAAVFTPGLPLLAGVRELTKRIHADFVYDPKATDVTTTITQLMQQRRGVCQDLSHLQIACLRSLGLAARYVSGYLLSNPPPGKPRLVGADASHAWLSVYLPGTGWVDVDPTNNLWPSDKHITIAWGRDYGDVTPLRGVILGGGEHTVTVSVDVQPLDEPT